MSRPRRVSPDCLLAAAAAEFAERGFAGARVDRIARRARANKAMLYYHFKNKETLYRTILRRLFSRAAARMQALAAEPVGPAAKIDRAVAALADLIQEDRHLPAIMLREVADGGARLDKETLAALAAVPRAVGEIVRQGAEGGDFRAMNPLFAYFSMLAPIVFFQAGAPIRRQLAGLHLVPPQSESSDDFITHMQETLRRAFARDTAAKATS